MIVSTGGGGVHRGDQGVAGDEVGLEREDAQPEVGVGRRGHGGSSGVGEAGRRPLRIMSHAPRLTSSSRMSPPRWRYVRPTTASPARRPSGAAWCDPMILSRAGRWHREAHLRDLWAPHRSSTRKSRRRGYHFGDNFPINKRVKEAQTHKNGSRGVEKPTPMDRVSATSTSATAVARRIGLSSHRVLP
jgi:hypothetical protein